MKGNDFPALPGIYVTMHMHSLSFDQLSAHNLGAREVGSLKRLAEGHNQQSGAQTGSSGSVPVIEIGSGESGPHRPKENAPYGGAVGNAGGLQHITSSESGGAEAKGVIHDSPAPGSVIPLDNAWENKG